ncbi:hypothetical protein BDQ94DRAFT_17865 [Aspergillus welwitschiae]|uniref:Uncharacterized protein n=1 Tax=Aspergillus welwitschiae TaxID=1341132 RepID=A0A3F3PHX3_9EURO|nr:hypothetical protein BDQ94DRAFT_17865 [Aspergillus welwitschiae]RDH26467.1 hypothetical protein BDQ94DRAFT_17865 [Aspergillus welwitschiae]
MRQQLTFLMASQLWSETRGSKAPSGICTDTMSYLEPLKLDCQFSLHSVAISTFNAVAQFNNPRTHTGSSWPKPFTMLVAVAVTEQIRQ